MSMQYNNEKVDVCIDLSSYYTLKWSVTVNIERSQPLSANYFGDNIQAKFPR